MKPVYNPESAWHKHSPFAFWLISKLKPETIVELGVHNGFSFFVFCQAGKRYRGKKMFYAIDHWEGDDHAGYFENYIYEKFILHQKKYKKISTVMKCLFEKALPSFEDNSIDLLHIDGRHFYEDVKNDFESWKTKLKPDAIVLFHDTQVFERDFGVHQFWKELISQYSLSFEFIHGHGLGVLCMGDGSTLPKSIFQLFALQNEKREEVQQVYKILGTQVYYEYLLKAYKIPFIKE